MKEDSPTSLSALSIAEFGGQRGPITFLGRVFGDDGQEEIAILLGGPA